MNKIKQQWFPGNPNNRRTQVQKPKWVGSFELKKMPDEARMFYKLHGPELFEKQLPMLIAASNLHLKRKFLPELPPLEYETMIDEFIEEEVNVPQLQLSATQQATLDERIADGLQQEM